MPMPKSKITRSRRGSRRAHNAVAPRTVHKCPNCDALVRPFNVCTSCGYYKGKEVVTTLEN